VLVQSLGKEAVSRGARMLRTALGPAIAQWLTDPAVVEVMLNPDGRLWIDRLTDGLVDTGEQLSAADGERIVRVVAHHVGAEVHAGSPRVSAELPETGERFEGLIPPVVSAPAFAIRKPAVAVFTLDNYVDAGIMEAEEAEILRDAIAQRLNVLVAGGTSTGKTTLVNALLAEVAKTDDRIVLIEDTRELQCKGKISSRCAPRTALPRSPIWCVHPFVCGPIASLLARSAALRPSTSSRRGGPDIPVASAPSMLVLHSVLYDGSSSWCRKPSSPSRGR